MLGNVKILFLKLLFELIFRRDDIGVVLRHRFTSILIMYRSSDIEKRVGLYRFQVRPRNFHVSRPSLVHWLSVVSLSAGDVPRGWFLSLTLDTSYSLMAGNI